VKRFIAAGICALVTLPALASAAGSPCELARVLKVRSVELAEAARASAAPHETAIFYVSLDCDGKTFVARIPGGTPGFDPDAIGALVAVQGWAEHGKSLRVRMGGFETEATLAPAGIR
jgi:hypothetical protein